MGTCDNLRNFMVERIGIWLGKMPEVIRPDVYAASLFIDDQGIEIVFSVNTNSRVNAAMAGHAVWGQACKVANSDALAANFATMQA